MAAPLNEEQVLRKLDIQDFRHVNKQQVIQLVNMLDKTDPEVAKAIIGQIPEFTATLRSIVSDYKDTITHAMEQNEKSNQAVMQGLLKQLDAASLILQDGEISFEEKKQVLDMMSEINENMRKQDKENKKWLSDTVKGVAKILGVVVLISAGVFGVSATVTKDGLPDSFA